jgi:hypothetical protein
LLDVLREGRHGGASLSSVSSVVAVEVGADGVVGAGHEVVDLRAGEPANLVDRAFVADEDGSRFGMAGWAGGEVDDLAAGLGVDSLAEDPAGARGSGPAL